MVNKQKDSKTKKKVATRKSHRKHKPLTSPSGQGHKNTVLPTAEQAAKQSKFIKKLHNVIKIQKKKKIPLSAALKLAFRKKI
jgi:hypothetical protein